MPKKFYEIDLRIRSHKLHFGVNFLTIFCKLNHLINKSNFYGIAMKRPNLQNRVSKFMPKTFYEITAVIYGFCNKL